MDPKLFKTVPGMSLRPLDQFLEFDEKFSEGQKSPKSRFLPKLTQLQKYAKMIERSQGSSRDGFGKVRVHIFRK